MFSPDLTTEFCTQIRKFFEQLESCEPVEGLDPDAKKRELLGMIERGEHTPVCGTLSQIITQTKPPYWPQAVKDAANKPWGMFLGGNPDFKVVRAALSDLYGA